MRNGIKSRMYDIFQHLRLCGRTNSTVVSVHYIPRMFALIMIVNVDWYVCVYVYVCVYKHVYLLSTNVCIYLYLSDHHLAHYKKTKTNNSCNLTHLTVKDN